MQVRLLGFRFVVAGESNPALTLSAFGQAVSAEEFKPTEAAEASSDDAAEGPRLENRRFFFFKQSADPSYLAGLVVTVKDQKTICKLVSDGGALQVKVSELGLDTKVMDFNFFVVHKETGAGLYQHYHQSCSVTSFGDLAARRFRSLRESLIAHALSNLPPADAAKPSKQKKVRKAYRARLLLELLVRKEKLEELIKELQRVKVFEWTIATPTVVEKEFTPLENKIRAETTRLSFQVGTPVANVASAVGAFIAANPLARGRVEGDDANGLSRVLRVMNNPENFGEYDFDQLAGQLNDLQLSKFEEASIIGELIKACKEHPLVFEKAMDA